jgi:hypothetical protein
MQLGLLAARGKVCAHGQGLYVKEQGHKGERLMLGLSGAQFPHTLKGFNIIIIKPL